VPDPGDVGLYLQRSTQRESIAYAHQSRCHGHTAHAEAVAAIPAPPRVQAPGRSGGALCVAAWLALPREGGARLGQVASRGRGNRRAGSGGGRTAGERGIGELRCFGRERWLRSGACFGGDRFRRAEGLEDGERLYCGESSVRLRVRMRFWGVRRKDIIRSSSSRSRSSSASRVRSSCMSRSWWRRGSGDSARWGLAGAAAVGERMLWWLGGCRKGRAGREAGGGGAP